MQLLIRAILTIILLSIHVSARASELLVHEVEPSSLVTNNLRLLGDINHFLIETIGAGEGQVGVYFVQFQDEPSSGFPFLAGLQAGEHWSADRRKSSSHFLGWTYTERYNGRRIVQMSPELVRKYYTRDQYGMFTIPNSPLWYAVGHELAHAHLFAKGVPEEEHHCYMVETGIVQKLIEYLTLRNALAFSPFMILRGEIATCENQKREKRERGDATPQ